MTYTPPHSHYFNVSKCFGFELGVIRVILFVHTKFNIEINKNNNKLTQINTLS